VIWRGPKHEGDKSGLERRSKRTGDVAPGFNGWAREDKGEFKVEDWEKSDES